MGYKKFILWIILFLGYIGFLHLFSTPVETSMSGAITEGVSGSSVVVPGISNLVTVEIIRAPRKYWFGIIKAPAYVLGMNIDSFNKLVIDYAMPLLLVVFIIWEVIIDLRKGDGGLALMNPSKGLTLVDLKNEKGKGWKNMDKSIFSNKSMLRVLARGLGIGILLAFFTFLFGDSPAIAVLLLVIYMEFISRK